MSRDERREVQARLRSAAAARPGWGEATVQGNTREAPARNGAGSPGATRERSVVREQPGAATQH